MAVLVDKNARVICQGFTGSQGTLRSGSVAVATRMLLSAAVLVLAACVEQTASSGDVGPGPELADPVIASMMFSDVCVDTAPSFAGAPRVLQSLPFRQHPETGTYYHTNLNLSFKVFSDGGRRICSIVFATDEAPGPTTLILAATGAGRVAIETSASRGPDGQTYINAKAVASR